jgi:hypothetical protein
LIATLTYSFARITAALTMKVEDLHPKAMVADWRVNASGHGTPADHAPGIRL